MCVYYLNSGHEGARSTAGCVFMMSLLRSPVDGEVRQLKQLQALISVVWKRIYPVEFLLLLWNQSYSSSGLG